MDWDWDKESLLAAVEHLRPTCIIGASDQGGSFNKQVRFACFARKPPAIDFQTSPRAPCEASLSESFLFWGDDASLVFGLLGLNRANWRLQVLEAMSRINERPVVFPLSTPAQNAECTAHEAYVITSGKAIFCSGVPFSSVMDKHTTFTPSQVLQMAV